MTETFQITREQAEAYEELFVPALFAQWTPLMIDIARIQEGQRVLDIACGHRGSGTRSSRPGWPYRIRGRA
jgi:ubiquinone/menaquinone biosynthesis C-methylase UbiE